MARGLALNGCRTCSVDRPSYACVICCVASSDNDNHTVIAKALDSAAIIKRASIDMHIKRIFFISHTHKTAAHTKVFMPTFTLTTTSDLWLMLHTLY